MIRAYMRTLWIFFSTGSTKGAERATCFFHSVTTPVLPFATRAMHLGPLAVIYRRHMFPTSLGLLCAIAGLSGAFDLCTLSATQHLHHAQHHCATACNLDFGASQPPPACATQYALRCSMPTGPASCHGSVGQPALQWPQPAPGPTASSTAVLRKDPCPDFRTTRCSRVPPGCPARPTQSKPLCTSARVTRCSATTKAAVRSGTAISRCTPHSAAKASVILRSSFLRGRRRGGQRHALKKATRLGGVGTPGQLRRCGPYGCSVQGSRNHRRCHTRSRRQGP